MSSTTLEVIVGASLLGSVLEEPEEYEELIREEVKEGLRELARRLLEHLEEDYRASPPRSGWEAFRRAEEALRLLVQREAARRLSLLLKYIDIENYVREQAGLFAARVDELYEDVYRRYTGRQELYLIEPILMTLTAVKTLYLLSLRAPEPVHATRRAAALLAALTVLVKQRRLDIVRQLLEVAEEILAEQLAKLQ
ncbi:MAG: hypothetical protein GXO09_01930 [Crenarchaeota archaeon]|nr:hypothetical protein [Thermoproteota archaeon]